MLSGIILTGMILGLCWGCGHSRTRRDNIILITLDTLRADHLGFHGYQRAQTPSLDAFAKEAFVFTHAFTTVNTTLSSHAAMLTGQFPQAIGVPRNSFPLPDDVPLLQEKLQEQGYTTAAFVSAVALCSRMGLQRGFAHFDETFRLDRGEQLERRAETTTRAVLAWLDSNPPEPYFVWVHYFDPHAPYDPPAPYSALFGSEYAGRIDGSLASVGSVSERMRNGRPIPEADIQQLIDLYDGEIAYLDQWVGTLLERFSDPVSRDKTFIVIATDHGESLTEHGNLFCHGDNVLQPNMHASVLIRPPADLGLQPRRIAAPVQTHSICPTVLSQLGIDVPRGMVAPDLMPLLRGSTTRLEGFVFGEASQPWDIEETFPDAYQNLHKAQMIVDYPWKLIVTPSDNRMELFHLEQDPGELTDVALENGERVSAMKSELDRWRSGDLRRGTHLDPEIQRRLRSLGYLK